MYSKGDSGKNGKYNFNGADVQSEMRAGDLHLGSSACSSDHGSSLDQESPSSYTESLKSVVEAYKGNGD
jgi:hypothetical protein